MINKNKNIHTCICRYHYSLGNFNTAILFCHFQRIITSIYLLIRTFLTTGFSFFYRILTKTFSILKSTLDL